LTPVTRKPRDGLTNVHWTAAQHVSILVNASVIDSTSIWRQPLACRRQRGRLSRRKRLFLQKIENRTVVQHQDLTIDRQPRPSAPNHGRRLPCHRQSTLSMPRDARRDRRASKFRRTESTRATPGDRDNRHTNYHTCDASTHATDTTTRLMHRLHKRKRKFLFYFFLDAHPQSHSATALDKSTWNVRNTCQTIASCRRHHSNSRRVSPTFTVDSLSFMSVFALEER